MSLPYFICCGNICGLPLEKLTIEVLYTCSRVLYEIQILSYFICLKCHTFLIEAKLGFRLLTIVVLYSSLPACSPKRKLSVWYALQMAYYKQYGETAATYESCSTSAFKHGRTETIRSATSATKQACQLFDKPGTSKQQLREALIECSNVHGQLTKEAAMGKIRSYFFLFCYIT